ncbi:calmodulin-binding protein 60 G-like isoform X1 [Cucurbita maxima]|uniref:Calmodulin-binding protein 60 G-like isoform X1 n=1 Tax=Cucurbita maxima TaxID=3661 RepID=A0A6J1HYY9_CUCMA|nr:calmodulin-binding protein 60 G-like isoform X1 [Cucurbita maxima]
MDAKGKGKAKMLPNDDDNPNPKRTRPSSSRTKAGTVAEDDRSLFELMSRIQPLLSNLVYKEVKNALQTHVHPLLKSLRERKEMGEEAIVEGGIEKFKLVFFNQPANTIFTNNEIKAENGEAVRVAIYDATTNAIVHTGPLSSAPVGLVLLDGDYDETNRSLSELNRNILSPREGKRPLLVGDGIKLILENGFASIKCVCITDNSSWMKSKKFRLGVMILDENILAMYPTIGAAVSQPFRAMDHRGEVNKKHHPPSVEDEVWRLEGIGKDGAYHKNLSSRGIKTVGAFVLKYQEIGPIALKKLLGTKVPKKTWMMMVANAFECQSYPIFEPSSKAYLSANNVAGDEAFNEGLDILEQNNLEYAGESPRMYLTEDDFGYRLVELADLQPLFNGEASTSYNVPAATTMPAFTPNTIKDL